MVFHVPGASADSNPQLDVGLVMSCWKGVKSPQVCASQVPVASCMAFRVVSLTILKEKPVHHCSPVLGASVTFVNALQRAVLLGGCSLEVMPTHSTQTKQTGQTTTIITYNNGQSRVDTCRIM